MAKAKQRTKRNGDASAPITPNPRRGPAYPVRPEWQENVKRRLAKLGDGGMTEKALAKKIGCAQSTIHDLLNSPEARYSSLVPAVHAAIGWDPPPDPGDAPPLPSPDAIELGHMYDRLPEHVKKLIRDQAKVALDLIGDTASRQDGN